MCIEVWNTFQRCSHRVFQSTFPCYVASQSGPSDELGLKRTKFLPDRMSKLPPGPSECRTKKVTRPLATMCPVCIRNERLAKIAASTSTNSRVTTASTIKSTTSSQLNSSVLSGKSISYRNGGQLIYYLHKK
ncbi:hypothetical protein F4805DRAFT_414422 [Annulohypoxylon moriforme]|nr:hypothetical protein F4805DRAFT_414422 [Annulohypoxylon moriforme]